MRSESVVSQSVAAGRFSSLEVCGGAGGLSLGLEQAGFDPVAIVESKPDACATLHGNRPRWTVLEEDFTHFFPDERLELFTHGVGIDLLAAGLPRLRSAATTTRVGSDQELFLIKATVWLAQATMPRALLIENVPGLATADSHAAIRSWIAEELEQIGYRTAWAALDAHDFGVPQRRPHGFVIALPDEQWGDFAWPTPSGRPMHGVGDLLEASMASRGWTGARAWAAMAAGPAPTIVGGSDKRGGADLGPSGSKRAWASLGVNGGSIADDVPDADEDPKHVPKLTVAQVARLQGFPEEWQIAGRKTSAYRQVGNACPPPLAEAVGLAIARNLSTHDDSVARR